MLPSVTSYLAAVTAPTIKQQNRARPLKTAAAAWTTKPVSTRCAATGRTSWRGRAKWIQHPQDTQSRPQNGTANYRGCHTRPKRWVQAIWVQGTQKRLGYIHRRPAIAQDTCCCTRMQCKRCIHDHQSCHTLANPKAARYRCNNTKNSGACSIHQLATWQGSAKGNRSISTSTQTQYRNMSMSMVSWAGQ